MKFLEWFIKDETQKKWADLGGYTCRRARFWNRQVPERHALQQSLLSEHVHGEGFLGGSLLRKAARSNERPSRTLSAPRCRLGKGDARRARRRLEGNHCRAGLQVAAPVEISSSPSPKGSPSLSIYTRLMIPVSGAHPLSNVLNELLFLLQLRTPAWSPLMSVFSSCQSGVLGPTCAACRPGCFGTEADRPLFASRAP